MQDHNGHQAAKMTIRNESEVARDRKPSPPADGTLPRAVGTAIKNALTDGKPSFHITRFEQPRPDIFALHARQLLGVGYRDCFIVGETVQAGETRILFKSVEYDHLPQLKLLGGLLTATVRQDSSPAEQARFQQQIREGAPMIEARIRRAIGRSDEK